MVKTFLKVIEEFKPKKDYGIDIRPQYGKVLSILKKEQLINPDKFIKENLNKFTVGSRSFKSNRTLIYHAFGIGKKIGILKPIPQEEIVPISFKDFCKLNTVSYFIKQLRGSRFRNLNNGKLGGTQYSYANRLWNFNNWLHGKEFEFSKLVPQGDDTYKKITTKHKLDSVESLLELYQQPAPTNANFIKIVKSYLLDPIHEGKRAKTIKIDYNAIKSYFDKNEAPLPFSFDYKNIYKTSTGEDEKPEMSLDDVMNLLTVGKPSVTQKVVFLCKLHRGLDTSTLIDRFNFQAWKQLAEYFHTEDYNKWDLSRCPVPIRLTRMKTDQTHTGFIDRDAVKEIQRYLNYRLEKTQEPMSEEKPLFLTERGKPITKEWINVSMRKLAKNASLDKTIPGYLQTKYKISSHEFRDLLKSTLIDCGVRPDAADHFIGHAPKDSYEKQATLYPETLRQEYAKASKRLNIFSNFSDFVQNQQSMSELQEKLSKMEDEIAKVTKRTRWMEKTRKKK